MDSFGLKHDLRSSCNRCATVLRCGLALDDDDAAAAASRPLGDDELR